MTCLNVSEPFYRHHSSSCPHLPNPDLPIFPRCSLPSHLGRDPVILWIERPWGSSNLVLPLSPSNGKGIDIYWALIECQLFSDVLSY